MGFDGWPLKGLPFLEIEQGEVQGKMPPPCPALLECGAGVAGQSELSPHLGCSLCSQWVRTGPPFLEGMLQGPAVGSSCLFIGWVRGDVRDGRFLGSSPVSLPWRY